MTVNMGGIIENLVSLTKDVRLRKIFTPGRVKEEVEEFVHQINVIATQKNLNAEAFVFNGMHTLYINTIHMKLHKIYLHYI